ncbi:MAG: DUF2062 domain-containing protein [Vicinamibacterales bacterium]|nr:DUF2062 domain-containing protein [Vicinamibacterales bacterium]
MSSSKFASEDRPGPARRGGALTALARVIRYRLIIPLFRSPHPPEFTARGVAVGVFWGLTPLVGAQSFVIAGLWMVARRIGWEFSLLQGLAWTWISNVFTMLPLYYLFYLTGMLMLGDADQAAGYRAFLALWQRATEAADHGFLTRVMLSVRVLGVPALLGCLPWAVAGAWVSYAWSYRIAERRQRKRAAREAARAAAHARDAGLTAP